MSLEEQDQILGRLIRRAQECKSRVVALQSKVLEYSSLLEQTVAGLHLASGAVQAPFRQSQTHYSFDAASWPSGQDIESTLSELYHERKELAAFEAQLSSIR